MSQPDDMLPPVSEAAMQCAARFLEKYTDTLQMQIRYFRDALEYERKRKGPYESKVQEDHRALVQFMTAIREVAQYGVVDTQAIRQGFSVLGKDLEATQSGAQYAYNMAATAEKRYRSKHKLTKDIQLNLKQIDIIDRNRAKHLEYKNDTQNEADELVAMQSDLIVLMKDLHMVTTRRPPETRDGYQPGL